jgi:hypothetical protein
VSGPRHPFQFAGRARTNRWNGVGERTLYLAGDSGVAIGEFARHYDADRTATIRRESTVQRIYSMIVTLDAVLDLRDVRVVAEPSLHTPYCFLDRSIARATAQLVRRVTPARGILTPSMAFLEDPNRWVLVLFLEKLPDDPHTYLASVEVDGVFCVDPWARSGSLRRRGHHACRFSPSPRVRLGMSARTGAAAPSSRRRIAPLDEAGRAAIIDGG